MQERRLPFDAERRLREGMERNVEERRRADRLCRVDVDPSPSRCAPGREPRDTRAPRTHPRPQDRTARRMEATPALSPHPSPSPPTLPLPRARRQRILRDRRQEPDATRVPTSFWDAARTARDRAATSARRAPIGVGRSVRRAAPDHEARVSDERRTATSPTNRRARSLASGKNYPLTGPGPIGVRRHANAAKSSDAATSHV